MTTRCCFAATGLSATSF